MSENSTVETMQDILHQQRQAQIKGGAVSAALRIDRLRRAVNVLEQNGTPLRCDERGLWQQKSRCLQANGYSRRDYTLKDAIKNVPTWMKPEKRKASFPMGLGGRCRIEFQPLGVIGCISPWNFPVQLTFAPLAGIFAAGNRTMIKPSEYTPITSALMKSTLEAASIPMSSQYSPAAPMLAARFQA